MGACAGAATARHFLFLALGCFAPVTPLADGCFVFNWDKETDINEPTQKAIIVHEAGREDLLLQVKYEGPLEEFGWLIPVPGLPKVEPGSMEPFYELSRLTQMQAGGFGEVTTLSNRSTSGGEEAPVQVIEVKTVGAYEVAVLSARDAGSLADWLGTHEFSFPPGKAEIADEYIRQGWFFVAARIQLGRGVSFATAPSAEPKRPAASASERKSVQAQLASGELHPLLISFDTKECIFPLGISAVGGEPSEVSLYVLSAEPLLNGVMFDKVLEKVAQRRTEWERTANERERAGETSLQNARTLQMAWVMHSLLPPPAPGERSVTA